MSLNLHKMIQKATSKKNSQVKIASPSFVKLAMRNMVKKGSKSLIHLSLTAFFFISFILLIAWLGRPNLP